MRGSGFPACVCCSTACAGRQGRGCGTDSSQTYSQPPCQADTELRAVRSAAHRSEAAHVTAAQASLQQDAARPSRSSALLGLREGSHTVTERWPALNIHSALRCHRNRAVGNYRRLSLVLTGQTNGPSPSLLPQTNQFSHAMATLPNPW